MFLLICNDEANHTSQGNKRQAFKWQPNGNEIKKSGKFFFMRNVCIIFAKNFERMPFGSRQFTIFIYMKRLLFGLLALMLASQSISAQEWRDENRWHDPFDIYAAPVGGLVVSHMTKFDSKTAVSPYVGGMIQTYFTNHWGMSFELGFSQQGSYNVWDKFHSDDELRNLLYTKEQQKRYMEENGGEEVPIPSESRGPYDYSFTCMNTLYKVRYYPIRNFCFTAGFLFNVHLKSKVTKENSSGSSENEMADHLHKRTAHVLGGFGYETKNLYVEGYYGFPLTGLAKSDFGEKRLGNARMHVIALTVGYRFKVY